MPDDMEVNAELPEESGQGNSDSGNQDINTPSENEGNSGQPNGEGGDNSDLNTKYNEVLAQNKTLNKLLVEARRKANLNNGRFKPGQANDQADEGAKPQLDYLTAKKIATSDLREELDNRFSFYEEEMKGFPPHLKSYVQQLRRNPWGFTSDEVTGSLNVDIAADEIEQIIADLVETFSSEGNPTPQGGPKVPPKNVRPNQAPEANLAEEVAVPGSAEDENPYTMPLDKLGRKAAQARKRLNG